MNLKDLILLNRSYRRFHQDVAVSIDLLHEMVDAARLSGSAKNMQPLKYMLFNDPAGCAKIFPTLAWAGYLKEWPGPEEGERPSAYIVQLADLELATDWWCDDGIAAQSMLLTAVEKGFGGCIIGSVQREKLRTILGIPERYKILQVLALGKPAEEVVIDEVQDDDIKYWRDENGVHHVPKRSLRELIIGYEPFVFEATKKM
ncbi:MAG: nitroreductase family protein [Bacteroidales bacterium]|nr:nitroreductase family protein [Bacteroidales bacterium]